MDHDCKKSPTAHTERALNPVYLMAPIKSKRNTGSKGGLPKLSVGKVLFSFFPNSFSYRGSYFKYRVRVRRFCGFVWGGAVGQGVLRGVV